jgi:hypothetical protein
VCVLVALYALSVWFRLPYLSHPMGLHHDEGTARTLVHAAVWSEEGPSSGGYIMRRNLSSPGDAYLGGHAGDGNVYYYSFPPGHPLLAFLAHSAATVEPTVDSVRWFNLVLGFLSAGMIYLIVRGLLRTLPDVWSRLAGFVAFTAYVFTPVGLWYHSNAYTSSSALQPFFIAALLAATYAYRPSKSQPWLWPTLFGVAVALMCYVEWLGPAFAAATVIVWLFRRDDAVLRRLAVAGAIGAAVSLGIVAAQYAVSLGGVSAVYDHVANRYVSRSGFGSAEAGGWTLWRLESWSRLGDKYLRSIMPLMVGLVLLWVWDWDSRRRRPADVHSSDPVVPVVLVLSIAPVLLHHVVLFNHTVVHDFDLLKSSVFFVLAIGVLSGRTMARVTSDGIRWTSVLGMAGVALLVFYMVARSAWMFDSYHDDQYRETIELGESISLAAVEPEEVVFIDIAAERTLYVPYSQIVHYSGRNYLHWPEDVDGRREVLERDGGRTGVVFVVDAELGVEQVRYVGIDGQTYDTREEAQATLSEESE